MNPERCVVLLAFALALTACGPDQREDTVFDLAVLAQSAEDFAQARPGRPMRFPRDHGAHPEYRIEWWYLTTNLSDADGRPFGAQWTLFRLAARPPGAEPPLTPWQSPQLFMAHLGITTPTEHHSFQRYARGGSHAGLAQAGVHAVPFSAWLDNWKLHSLQQQVGAEWLPLEVFAEHDGHGLRLRLDSDRPPVLHGIAGFSPKHPDGGGSYYYSQPFLRAEGRLWIDGESIAVRGQAWLDREWSSQFLQPDQVGWDWFALHLLSGEKLMLYRLRGRGQANDHVYGVLFPPEGPKRILDPGGIRFQVLGKQEIAGRSLPLKWRLELPEIGRRLEVEALHPGQWMDVDFPYWEGMVRVRGEGPESSGRGYLELTGYSPSGN